MIREIQKNVINSTSSSYISDFDKREKWIIDKVQILDHQLKGLVSIQESKNALRNDFHLSFFTAIEFASQLQIIFMHHHAKLNKKTEEVWMLESTFKSKNKITKTQSLFVDIKATKIKVIRNFFYCWATHKISDDVGGLFEIKIKAIMKLPPT
jgi:hypothetical protein